MNIVEAVAREIHPFAWQHETGSADAEITAIDRLRSLEAARSALRAIRDTPIQIAVSGLRSGFTTGDVLAEIIDTVLAEE